MILVKKPATPAKLSDGDPLTQDYCDAFELNPGLYRSGKVKFEIKPKIYNHVTVKYELGKAHHGKCCFCESVFEANASADIEHYRPKAFSQQGCGTPKIFPGYYWLAYDWDNLFYCCQVCNRSHKKNLFPLRDQNLRARSHLCNLDAEEPLILNPGGPDNPRDHIHFHEEVAVGVTGAGMTTIKIVGLNRSHLIEERLKRLQELQGLRDIIQVFHNHQIRGARNLAKDAQAKLNIAEQSEATFSAMASDFLNKAGIP